MAGQGLYIVFNATQVSCVCAFDFMYMYVCMYVWGLVVKWFVHWAHDPWVMSSSPTTRRWILSNLLPLPPTTPTSPPSCEWVPGVSWGANHSSFSLNSSGPGGTSGAHTTGCEKVAGPSCEFLARCPGVCLYGS